MVNGGIIRGYTLSDNRTIEQSAGKFYLITSDYNELDKLWYNFKFTPIMFIKHKILIYNPNGYTLTYSDWSSQSEEIISPSETGVTEFNFYIDFDNNNLLGYNDYYYVFEKINSDGTTKKYTYMKNWY